MSLFTDTLQRVTPSPKKLLIVLWEQEGLRFSPRSIKEEWRLVSSQNVTIQQDQSEILKACGWRTHQTDLCINQVDLQKGESYVLTGEVTAPSDHPKISKELQVSIRGANHKNALVFNLIADLIAAIFFGVGAVCLITRLRQKKSAAS